MLPVVSQYQSRSEEVLISLKTGSRFLSQRAVYTGPQQGQQKFFSDIKEKHGIL